MLRYLFSSRFPWKRCEKGWRSGEKKGERSVRALLLVLVMDSHSLWKDAQVRTEHRAKKSWEVALIVHGDEHWCGIKRWRL